jgi:hypothetical protein
VLLSIVVEMLVGGGEAGQRGEGRTITVVDDVLTRTSEHQMKRKRGKGKCLAYALSVKRSLPIHPRAARGDATPGSSAGRVFVYGIG